MKKIVLGIVVMAVLLGGLGAGFATGYEYKSIEEEQLFDEIFMEMNEGGCSCYYTGDMREGFECMFECIDDYWEDRLDTTAESLEEEGKFYCLCDGQELTCEEIQSELEKAVNCAYCNMIANYHEINTHEEAERIASEIIMSYEEGGRFYIADMTPEDMGYWKAKAFCED
ncbi:MAG: hypothetical protein KAW47_00250 [Thermoplasmatales archaeon]|nr:hypothetical protein [Thermoplasmatales archaeon]